MSNIKNPPIFNPEKEGNDYLNWKKDVQIWQMVTPLAKEKQGPALYLSLEGTARDKVRAVDTTQLNSNTGVEHITELLDEIYLKDQSTRAYCAFKDFVEYRRKSGDDYTAFIVHFEQLYQEIVTHEMTLPTGARAFFLLQAANLPDESERLARVTSKMDYDDMKTQIHKIFGESHGAGCTMPIKLEECNYTQRGRFNAYRDRFNKHNSKRFEKPLAKEPAKETNPLGPDKKPLTCHICSSTMHFANKCPHRKKKVEANVVEETQDVLSNITLIAGDGKVMSALMADNLGFGVLDSACTKTVAGEKWLEEYKNTLDLEEIKAAEATLEQSKSVFRFGDGVETKSKFSIVVPAQIGAKMIKLKIEIVPCDIPLLISKPTMVKLGMVIDFATGKARALDQDLELRTTQSGHYCIPIKSKVS